MVDLGAEAGPGDDDCGAIEPAVGGYGGGVPVDVFKALGEVGSEEHARGPGGELGQAAREGLRRPWNERREVLSPAPSAIMAESGDAVCNFFRKPSTKKQIRKRSLDDEADDGDGDTPAALPKAKKAPMADNKLLFSTAGSSSKPPDASGDVEDDEPSSSKLFHFESSNEIQVQHDNRATATLETETEFSRDARAIRERVLKQAEEALKGAPKAAAGDKVYCGIHGYTDYKAGFRREHTVAGEKAGGAHGPLRASAHIRASARFDYQPDICKDYKETGYCGFGDSCKFMHDRGDYKSGWQIEREWEEAEKARKRSLAMGGGAEDGDGGDEDDDDGEDSLPFACFICRRSFEDPVVTKCKHYFCEHCALKHHKTNKKCFVCNKPTLGIFNVAHEIKKKMAESK